MNSPTPSANLAQLAAQGDQLAQSMYANLQQAHALADSLPDSADKTAIQKTLDIAHTALQKLAAQCAALAVKTGLATPHMASAGGDKHDHNPIKQA